MATVKEISEYFESIVPCSMKMDFDNVGFLVGDGSREVQKALVVLDITDEVIEAWPHSGAELLLPAFLQRIQLIYHLEDTPYCSPVRIRPEIAVPVPFKFSCTDDPRPLLRSRYLYVRVRFAVLEQDVIFRHELLDKVAFQNKSFHLRCAGYVFKFCDIGDKSSYFRVSLGGLPEIRSHPVSEVDRLTDIYDLSEAVFMHIYSRTCRELT